MMHRKTMTGIPSFFLWVVFLLCGSSVASAHDELLYDSSAYTTCEDKPAEPLYDGGLLKFQAPVVQPIAESTVSWPAFLLQNLTQDTIYCFSSWLKIDGPDPGPVRASLMTEHTTYECIGTVIANNGCWSFLKGGFQLHSFSRFSLLYFQSFDGRPMNITIESASLQPFTMQQWRFNQQHKIDTERKRAVTIHVSDDEGHRLSGANVTVKQVFRDFLFGSAIGHTILGNIPYQEWFTDRFNVAVFENELKWDFTEPERGKVSYAVADQMLKFVRANQIAARGHNIFWENPETIPKWVHNLTGFAFESALVNRIESLVNRYKGEFIHWDVCNEALLFDFYEQRLGHNATLQFFLRAHELDPLATLFMNEIDVVETCNDHRSTVDAYILRMRELIDGGVSMGGIGLEGHFQVPNLPLMRAILDKLATLGLPIWLTELDINSKFDHETQAIYLEEVLRESFSHPSVKGIMLWSPLHPDGCYQMCLTDINLNNLPAGDVVDRLLTEWQTGTIHASTDKHGAYSFHGFLGEFEVTVAYGRRRTQSTFSLACGDDTKHFNIQL